MPSASPEASGTPEGATPVNGAGAHSAEAMGNRNHTSLHPITIPTVICTSTGTTMPASVPKRIVRNKTAGTIHEDATVTMTAVARPASTVGAPPPAATTTTLAANTTKFAAKTRESA